MRDRSVPALSPPSLDDGEALRPRCALSSGLCQLAEGGELAHLADAAGGGEDAAGEDDVEASPDRHDERLPRVTSIARVAGLAAPPPLPISICTLRVEALIPEIMTAPPPGRGSAGVSTLPSAGSRR